MDSLQSVKRDRRNPKRGEWLQAVAARAGFASTVALAAAVGVTRQAVAGWFKGTPIRQQPVLDKLAAILGVRAGQILAGPYPMPPDGVNWAVNNERGGVLAALAYRVGRAVETVVLTVSSPDSLIVLANWMEGLAKDLKRLSATYDDAELRATAEALRKMAG